MNPKLLTTALAAICLALTSAASADNFLIVPGRSIGQMTLGPNGAAALKHLPPPDAEDSGMMQSHLVWVSHTSGHANTLFMQTTRNAAFGNVKPADGVTISTLRITSRQFHTRSGISTASTLAQIRRRFPDARADRFTPQIYGDTRHGIAFEFTRPITSASRCRAISVLSPGSSYAATTQSGVNDLLKSRN